jgi:hypothetical protein
MIVVWRRSWKASISRPLDAALNPFVQATKPDLLAVLKYL